VIETPVPVQLPPPTIAGSFRHAWETLKARWPRLLVLVFLWLVVVVAGAVGQAAWERNESASQVGQNIGLAFSLLVVSPVELGLIYAFLKAVRGGKPEVDDLFAAFHRNYLSAVLAPALAAVLVTVGVFLFVLPGIYLAIRFAFVGFLVLDEGLGPLQALRASWRLTEGRFWTLLGAAALGLFAIWVGLFLVLVGAVAGFLWAGLAFATLYAAARRERA